MWIYSPLRERYLVNRTYSFSHDGEPFTGRLLECRQILPTCWALRFRIGKDEWEWTDRELSGLGLVVNIVTASL